MVIAVIAVVSSGLVLRYAIDAAEKRKRETAFQSAFLAYSQNMRPGLTRSEVETQLRVKRTIFSQQCCFEDQKTVADLVKIGEGDPPWYCGKLDVFIAFEFAATELHDRSRAYDSDVLTRVEMTRVVNSLSCLGAF